MTQPLPDHDRGDATTSITLQLNARAPIHLHDLRLNLTAPEGMEGKSRDEGQECGGQGHYVAKGWSHSPSHAHFAEPAENSCTRDLPERF